LRSVSQFRSASASDLLLRVVRGVACLGLCATLFAQSPTSYRYFYDDANEVYRVLDSTGTLIEYTYDLTGNITNVSRSSLPANQLSILNVVPSNAIGGTMMTILGQNFSSVASGDIVMIGGVAATVISASATKLVVMVPPTSTGGMVSVTVGGVTATWSNTVAVSPVPSIGSVSPNVGTPGATVNLAVIGEDLAGAAFALRSLDPVNINGAASLTVVSNAGTSASLAIVLGTTQGQYALTATNAVGPSQIVPASLFTIGPINNSASSYTSVLNTASINPQLPPGQNSASFEASVLNDALNTTTNPPFPPGASEASAEVSVLNAEINTAANPPLPPGQNDVSYYASVLNAAFNPANAGISAAASLGISVCNTSSGCTATPTAMISADASAARTTPRPGTRTPGAPLSSAPPELLPFERRTTVIAGETIRLQARNVAAGESVDFYVNQAIVASVGEPPYETLFTVPEGIDELTFQVNVSAAGGAERVSPMIHISVAGDTGAAITGAVAQGTAGIELTLSAGGLKSEFFHFAAPLTALPALAGLQPVRTGFVTALNQPNPNALFGDDPFGAHLSPDYAIRFSGELWADTIGEYKFWLTARSGAAIRIDGKPLADTGFAAGDPAEAYAAVPLDRGWHSIEVIYYLAVGASSLRLEWQRPDGSRREVIGPEYLRTGLTGMKAISATDGAFAFPPVPERFDSVWIGMRSGTDLVAFPPVKAGAKVSLSVPR